MLANHLQKKVQRNDSQGVCLCRARKFLRASQCVAEDDHDAARTSGKINHRSSRVVRLLLGTTRGGDRMKISVWWCPLRWYCVVEV